MSTGRIYEVYGNEDCSFNVLVQNIRRKAMMDHFVGKAEARTYGGVILRNVKASVEEARIRNLDPEEVEGQNFYMRPQLTPSNTNR